jgi:ABC-type nitrate/sulfonate/bicarbonate transport system substrate-binding protein
MVTIRVGGVPEHFNLPWHLSIEDGSFEKAGIDLQWIEYPGGTGAMCKALRANEIDIAVILTEGIIKDITDGNPSKIIQTYVESPLLWGIHVAYDSEYRKLSDLEYTTAAISRYKSGSHLMAFVHAEKEGYNTDSLDFHIVKNLDGAITELTNGNADYFMWEHFTTKPLVDDKTFRRLGDQQTPWPCFVIAATDAILEYKKEAVKQVLVVINNITQEFKEIPSIDKSLAIRYEQKLEDIHEWLEITEWSQSQLSTKNLSLIQDQLLKLKLISNTLSSTEVLKNL